MCLAICMSRVVFALSHSAASVDPFMQADRPAMHGCICGLAMSRKAPRLISNLTVARHVAELYRELPVI